MKKIFLILVSFLYCVFSNAQSCKSGTFQTTDLAVINFIQPSTSYLFILTVNYISLSIQNQGQDTLSGFLIGYKKTGTIAFTQTYNDTLYPGMSDTFTIAHPVIPMSSASFNICGFVSAIADINTSNDTVCKHFLSFPKLHIPDVNDFEGLSNYWLSQGNVNDWQLGNPIGNVINSAFSGLNSWCTQLSGNYSNNADGILYTPFFDFLNYGAGSIEFRQWMDAESNVDGVYIQYLNNQDNWITLGIQNDTNAVNWYNAFANGQYFWTGQSNGWIQSIYDISTISDFGWYTQFRFVFFSDSSNNSYDGWAIDDFEINVPPIPFDAGVIKILSPGDTVHTGDTIISKMWIKNFGSDTLDTIPVNIIINNGIPISSTCVVSLPPGDTTEFTFTNGNTYGSSVSILCASTNLPNDVYTFNDSVCKNLTLIWANYDLGIIKLVKPPCYYLNSNHQVIIRVGNFGIQAVTNPAFVYKYSNFPPVIESYSGTILPGDTLDYHFNQLCYFTLLIGYHLFKAYTSIPNDDFHFNDTMYKSIPSCGISVQEINNFDIVLNQNHPNPSHQTTTISFEMKNPGEVILTIANLLGEILYKEKIEAYAGKNEVNLDVNRYNNGVYFYSIEQDGIRHSRKMVVY